MTNREAIDRLLTEQEGDSERMELAKHMGARALANGAAQRPCEVDSKPCIFHRWVDADQVLMNLKSSCREDAEKIIQQFNAGKVAGPNFSTEVIRKTYALVEYPDGSVGKVEPEMVKFTDKEGKK